jgi:diaminopropionate ammonia-lyase
VSGSHAAWYSNPLARQWRCAPPRGDAARFHAGLPGYRPTELVEVRALAAELGVGRVFVKDESGRLGLGAFKVLGASWAVARLLAGDVGQVPGIAELRDLAGERPVKLVTATDGNHGRAVAYVGRLLGLPVRVFIPAAAPVAARARIAAEGAEVTVVDRPYDSAVEEAAGYAAAGPGCVLVQDTAWSSYEQVPGWIVEGYDTVLSEVDATLRAAGLPWPGLVCVPVGVGSLAQAVVTHYRSPLDRAAAPAVLGVEPDAAPCLLASLLAGEFGSIDTGETVMAGLNCGTPSSLAWPVLVAGLDAAIAVPDQAATQAVADLVASGVSAGPTGAACLAGARAALAGDGSTERRADLGATESSVVVLLNTEGQS